MCSGLGVPAWHKSEAQETPGEKTFKMANISLHGEDISIEVGKSYYVIDALYLGRIKEELSNTSIANDIEEEIKSKIFPYTEAPFAIISINSGNLLASIKVSDIKKSNDENINARNFSTDSGLVVIIEKSIFIDFINLFNYDKLVEGETELLNKGYWEQFQKNFGEHQCGVILAPGTNSEFEFDGSGLYEIFPPGVSLFPAESH